LSEIDRAISVQPSGLLSGLTEFEDFGPAPRHRMLGRGDYIDEDIDRLARLYACFVVTGQLQPGVLEQFSRVREI
jgi:hypothetical protein